MRIKILIISDAWYPQVNGVVRTYEYLCKELRKNGHVADVIGPADFAASIPTPFYPEIKLVLRPYKRLSRLISDLQPDRIHIATEGPLGWAARRYCIRNNVAFTSAYHTQFPDYIAKRFAWLIPPLYNAVHRFGIAIVRHFHRRSKNVFVSTKSLEKQLLGWGFTPSMAHMTRGIDSKIFYPAKKESPPLKEAGKLTALYVGRVAIEKNLDDFLCMPWQGQKIIVGDGPIRTALEEKYPDVQFVGNKSGSELADYYRGSDIFVFPSKTDTFGIVLIEALACGLPVAAYDVTGPRDIITDARLGALDQNNLLRAVETALSTNDPKFCAQHAKEHYSWEIAGKQFLKGL